MTVPTQLQPVLSQKLPWIKVCDNAPYFEDENGESFTPIGQNDAVSWPDFQGLFRRKDPEAVDAHLAYLATHGVNCIRMMMEYCQTENRYLEKPAGNFQPNMIRFWDDLFELCEKHKIRILVTPFDTFWMARRWKFHPYNKRNGGPCNSKFQWLKSIEMLSAVKRRFDFFIERWGKNGALLGWDLWNEITPLHAGRELDQMVRYVEDISAHIRRKETALYQKTHLQTLSAFAPTLTKYDMNQIIFQHPALDFATTHFYDAASIDNPKNTHSAAQKTADMVKHALANTATGRPFLDTEHGPITYFKRRRHGVPETFDDEYFRHMQWAHLASGGAGGGMRWPYRHPHVLTHGMRKAQLNLSMFAKLIGWQNFRRANLNGLITVDDTSISAFGCGDAQQAIVWLLRVKALNKKRAMADTSSRVTLSVPGLGEGTYSVVFWDTITGHLFITKIAKGQQDLKIDLAMPTSDLALAIRRNH